MKSFRVLFLVPLASCGLASCGLATAEQAPRGERAQTRLVRALDGLVAGEARRCIAMTESRDIEIFDRGTVLFTNGSGLVYRNDPEGGCPGLGAGRAIVSTSPGSQLCRGDGIRVVDQLSGSVVGACAYADFIPYRRPDAARR